jgi:hypothetical protein
MSLARSLLRTRLLGVSAWLVKRWRTTCEKAEADLFNLPSLRVLLYCMKKLLYSMLKTAWSPWYGCVTAWRLVSALLWRLVNAHAEPKIPTPGRTAKTGPLWCPTAPLITAAATFQLKLAISEAV